MTPKRFSKYEVLNNLFLAPQHFKAECKLFYVQLFWYFQTTTFSLHSNYPEFRIFLSFDFKERPYKISKTDYFLTFFIRSPFSICLSMSDFYIYLFSWNTKLGLWRNLKAIDAWRFPWKTLFPHLIILNFHHLWDSRMRTNLFCNFKNAKPRSLDIWKEMDITNLSFTEITMSKHSYVSVTLYERCLHKTSHNRGPNIAKNPLI